MNASKNILVPIDFSNRTQYIINYAIGLAQEIDARLHILHVYHAPIAAGNEQFAYSESYFQEIENEVSQKLKEIESNHLLNKNVGYEFIKVMGNTIDEIEKTINEKKIDLIIMGARGTSLLDKLMGSITTEVVHSLKCPTLVIPDHAEFRHINRIAFACDFNWIKDIKVLEVLKDMAQIWDAEVHILGVNKKDELLKLANTNTVMKLNKYLKDIKYSFDWTEAQNIEFGIETYVKDNSIDLLVMTPRKHNLLERIFKGSVTDQLTLDTKVPLLCVHE